MMDNSESLRKPREAAVRKPSLNVMTPKARMKIGAWNVRTLASTGKLANTQFSKSFYLKQLTFEYFSFFFFFSLDNDDMASSKRCVILAYLFYNNIYTRIGRRRDYRKEKIMLKQDNSITTK
ncbi:hypothetical protein GQR58_013406 [Nymphon striatum]|nr:hypothetical protein GQR58_013406 [Nymphon striatum]